jgi:hypothetical protein
MEISNAPLETLREQYTSQWNLDAANGFISPTLPYDTPNDMLTPYQNSGLASEWLARNYVPSCSRYSEPLLEHRTRFSVVRSELHPFLLTLL